MIIFRNVRIINVLILLCTLVLFIVFTLKIKEVYFMYQKNSRYHEYKQDLEKLSLDFEKAEKRANKSADYVRKISEVIIKYERDLKNTTCAYTQRCNCNCFLIFFVDSKSHHGIFWS
ncbi:GSCOCG00002723001-RA-CDS [Cotesia congregata]|nr:GSCOCG00002723001-RA-CDS [Cotesia congregata]